MPRNILSKMGSGPRFSGPGAAAHRAAAPSPANPGLVPSAAGRDTMAGHFPSRPGRDSKRVGRGPSKRGPFAPPSAFFGILMAGALALLAGTARGEAPIFRMGLDESVRAALASSDRIRSAEGEYQAARQRLWGAGGLLLPQVSLEGSWRHVTEVPELQVSPKAEPVKLGDNRNYSIGPTASWTAWDWGASYQAWRAANEAASAARDQLEATRRQVKLAVSVSYVQTQMALEQVRLVADALALARAQYRDIGAGLAAGSVSRLDSLMAHQEVLARRRLFAAARADLAGVLQDFFVLTRTGTGLDTSSPMDARLTVTPEGGEEATVRVAFDPLDDSLARLENRKMEEAGASNPAVRSLARFAESSHHAATAVLASHLPRVQLMARTSLDYPNGPVLEEIRQNMVGVAVSMPLFAGGQVFRGEWEKREEAKSLEGRRDLALAEARRDWRKASDRLALLRVQLGVAREAAAETKELAKLTYDSYQTGAVRFTDVQAANLKALEAQVQEAQTKAEMLVQLAILASLSKEE